MTYDNSHFLALAHQLMDVAREQIIPIFRKDEIVTEKKISTNSPFELVTEADKAVENKIKQIINNKYPNHGIIGEETGKYQEKSEYVWVIDPIDGTKAFLSGLPVFGTMIALYKNNNVIMGMIDQAITGERIWSIDNKTKLNGNIVRTRKCNSLSKAIIACTDPSMFGEVFNIIQDIIFSKSLFVRYGTDCWGYAMCASGFIDAVIEKDIKAWDVAAADSIITSAGGIITSWTGQPLGIDDTACAAGDPILHSKLIKKLQNMI